MTKQYTQSTWFKHMICVGLLVAGAQASTTDARLAGTVNFMNESSAFLPVSGNRAVESILTGSVVSKAKPDECFNGIGQPYKPLIEGECTEANEQPKVNAAYVWGLTGTSDYVWFGTMANTECAVVGTYLGQTTASINDSWVCEQAQSKYPAYMAEKTGNTDFLYLGDNGLGDWRVPHMYRYSKKTGETEEITPQDPKVIQTLGLRSAGTLDGVIFMAGPAFGNGNNVAVNMFAFKDDAAHTYLGSHTFNAYSNIRKWIVADGVLYTAVGANSTSVEGLEGDFAGRVLRWTGSASDPFKFEEVAYLPGSGAEFAVHKNRIYVTTWPGSELSTKQILAGVYRSPVLPSGGLTSATVWDEIWNASAYEPDPVVALTYGGGAIASFDGYLYWGTMHVPGVAAAAMAKKYNIDTSDQQKMIELFFNTNRAISIYRSSDPESDAKVELMYGDTKLPTYNPETKSFVEVDNKMGAATWGESGFGNMFNNYTWTMRVYNHKLYVGTMDWSYLAQAQDSRIVEFLKQQGIEIDPGADLWRIESSSGSGAIAEDLTGVGNYANYGIRTTLIDEKNLYLGMANPMNLMTNPDDDKPQGGWELLKMTDPSMPEPTATPAPTPAPTDQPIVKKSGGGAFDLMDLGLLLLLFGLFGWKELDTKRKNSNA